MRKAIVVDYIHPPIPNRNFDYRAYFDGYEPGDIVAFGPSPEEAVQELIALMEEAEDRE